MSAVIEFARGANAVIADTVGALHLCVALSWVSGDAIDRDVDVIALRLSGEGRVGTESDFIFYNAPKCADGSVRMAGRRCVNGRCVDELSVDLAAQPSDVATILIAAVVTSATFQDVTGLELTVRADDLLDPVMRVDLTGARSERAYVAGEFYRRNNEWKFRAIGQGWDTGLAGLAVNYGVDIDTSPPTSAPHTSDAGPESTTRPSTGPIEDLGSISDGSRTPNPTRNPQPNPRPSSPQDRPRTDTISAVPTTDPQAKERDYSALVDQVIDRLQDNRGQHLHAQERAVEEAASRSARARKSTDTPADRRMYKDSRLAEAAAQTALLEARVAHLGDLLNKMIAENGPLEPAMLVSRPVLPQFPPGALAVETAPPDPRRYGVPEPTGMGKVFSRARHAAAVAEANALYEQHRAQHAAQERDRQRRFADAESAHRREVDRLNGDYRAQIDSLQPIWRDAAAGSAHAIVVYNELLLSAVTGRASYPPDFPRQFRIAYTPESRQLTVEFDLPPATVIPPEKAYRYTANTDTISAAPRTATDAKRLYADAIAQTSLGIIYALFRGDSHQDHQGHTRHGFDTVVFNGVVDAIDPATGAAIRPCLVTTRATRDSFNQLDLRNVDPAACLRHLGASVSKSPAELVPVRPVLEFSMVDPRFIADTDVLGNLDTRTNLMELTPTQFESLITNLFSTMGLETRQTQASRDGGVDCVAYDPRPIFGGKVVIQAKRYKNTVGVSAVRDLYGTMQNEGASKGILVTTSGYGQASHQFAANKPLELIDGTGLLYLLAEHAGIDARIIPPDDWHDPEPDTRTD